MHVKRIVANIAAKDVARAKRFYQDILGLDVLMDLGWIVTYGTSQKMSVQVSIASEGGSGTPVPDISIEVDDLEAALQRMKVAKVAVEYGPADELWGVRRFYVRDPFGRLVNILMHRQVMEHQSSDWNLPWAGGCRCNSTRIAISKAPLLTMACHCTGCQRMTASAFSLSIAVPADGFEITAGAPILGGLSRDMHFFCPECLSWMFTRPVGMDWFVNVRVPVLDHHHWVEPFVETYTAEKLPWARTPARHSFETVPELSAYDELVREFSLEGKRPGPSSMS